MVVAAFHAATQQMREDCTQAQEIKSNNVYQVTTSVDEAELQQQHSRKCVVTGTYN